MKRLSNNMSSPLLLKSHFIQLKVFTKVQFFTLNWFSIHTILDLNDQVTLNFQLQKTPLFGEWAFYRGKMWQSTNIEHKATNYIVYQPINDFEIHNDNWWAN